MINGINVNDLNIISSNEGSVFHVLKKSNPFLNDFGEVYFSTVNYNSVKAWKMHKKMTLNLIVPKGEVLFCFFVSRRNSKTFNCFFEIILSKKNYKLLTVSPNIWFGFKGLSKKTNLICNIADIEHDDNEILRKNIDEINFNWKIK